MFISISKIQSIQSIQSAQAGARSAHRSLSLTIVMSALCLGGLVSCVEAPNYFYAERITGETFTPIDDTVGVYPSVSVLEDPANPFRRFGVGAETKWDVESGGDPVAGFYAWATLLASQPTGEHQYYAAINLRAIYERGRASEEDLDLTRELALAAFQSVLDHFPESVTFDASGRVAYGLATFALQQMIELEGTPTGGWSLAATSDGGVVAVQTLDVPPPADDEEEEE